MRKHLALLLLLAVHAIGDAETWYASTVPCTATHAAAIPVATLSARCADSVRILCASTTCCGTDRDAVYRYTLHHIMLRMMMQRMMYRSSVSKC